MKKIKRGGAVALLIALLLVQYGCMTTQKATDYLKKNNALAEICANEYPPKIEYKAGEIITKSDTTYLPGDSVPCPPAINGKDTIRVKVKCPDQKIIRDTTYRVDTVTMENTARVLDLQYKLGDANAHIQAVEYDNSKLTKRANILSLSLFVMILLIVIYIVLRIKKIF